MKRLSVTAFTLALLSTHLFAHKEWVHQYMVKEAYWALEIQHGVPITVLKDHTGFSSFGRGGLLPFYTLEFSAGAKMDLTETRVFSSLNSKRRGERQWAD